MDARQLETVSRFAVLLEVLSDPEGLRKMIGEIKQVIEEDKKYLGMVTTKEEADKYLEDAKKILEASKEKIKQDEDIFAQNKDNKEKEIKETKAAVDAALSEAKEARAEAQQKLAEAETAKAMAVQIMQEATAANDSSKQEYARLISWEAELKAKAEKMMQLIGN